MVLLLAVLLLGVAAPFVLGAGGGPTAGPAAPHPVHPEAGGSSLPNRPQSGPRVAPNAPAVPAVEWPTFLHDAQRTGANLEEQELSPTNVGSLGYLWNFSANRTVTGSSIVVNGTVYFGDWDGNLNAVNASTGSLTWATSLGGIGDFTGCSVPGIAATPAYWNGTLYIGGGNPWLYAVAALNGTILWHTDLANVTGSSTPWTAHKIWSSVLVYNGSLYVGVASGCDSPLVRGALFQVDAANGTIAHTFWTLPAGQTGPGIWSSASVDPGTRTIWVTTGNEGSTDTKYARSVIGLNASNVSQVVGYAQEALAFHDYDFGDGATLFHDSNGTPMVVAVNKNGYAYAFNESSLVPNGTSPTRWTVELTPYPGNSYVPPAYDGHLLYFGSVGTVLPNGSSVAGSVRAVYPDNGTTKWWVGTSSAIYGALTYANGVVYAPMTSGGIRALDAKTGELLASVSTHPTWGEPTVVNGEVLVGFGPTGTPYTPGGLTALSVPLSASGRATPVPGNAATTYAFNATVAGGVAPITISWSFGDGTSANGTPVTHAFAASGVYRVTMTATDATGAERTQNLTLTARAPLEATPTLTPNPVFQGDPVWVNLSVVGGEPPYTVNWTGLPPSGTPPPPANSTNLSLELTPVVPGTYDVIAEVTSPSGQALSVGFPSLTVEGPASVGITATPSSGFAPLTVSFAPRWAFPGVTGAYAWAFGDGTTSSQVTPAHTYTAAGRYSVTLRVTFPQGATVSANLTVLVRGVLLLPAVELVTTDVGHEVNLTANVSGGRAPYTFGWSGLPDGCAAANTSRIGCTPVQNGTFPIALSVTDTLGDDASALYTLLVHPAPAVRPTLVSAHVRACGAPGPLATYTVAAVPTGGTLPYTFSWADPGPLPQSGPQVVITFDNPGLYGISVFATDAFGVEATGVVGVSVPAPECSAPTVGPSLEDVGLTALALGGIAVIAVGLFLRRRPGGPHRSGRGRSGRPGTGPRPRTDGSRSHRARDRTPRSRSP